MPMDKLCCLRLKLCKVMRGRRSQKLAFKTQEQTTESKQCSGVEKAENLKQSIQGLKSCYVA